MGGKRKRRSTIKQTSARTSHRASRKGTPKRFRQEQPLSSINILSLPSETLDQIITYTIYDKLPREIRNGNNARATVPNLLTMSLLRVCRTLRQQTVSMIREGCVLIKVTASSRESVQIMYDLVNGDEGNSLPLMRDCYRRSVWGDDDSDSPNIIHIDLNQTSKRHHIIRTRGFNPECLEFCFPYDYDSFLLLAARLDKFWEGLDMFTLYISRLSGYANEIWLSRIKPVLMCYARVTDLVGHKDPEKPHHTSFHIPLDQVYDHGKTYIRNISLTLKARMKVADDLRRRGHHEEAGLWFLYSPWSLTSLGDMFLPCPYEWESGETNPDDQVLKGSQSGQNSVGNEVRSLLVRVQYESCLAWWLLYQKHGVQFVESHFVSLACSGFRWTWVPRHQWFGLDDHQRAQMHYCHALAVRVRIDVYWQRGGMERDKDADLYSLNYGRHGKSSFGEILALAIANAKAACALYPGNQMYDAVREWLWEYVDNEDIKINRWILEKYQLNKRMVEPEDYTMKLPLAVQAATGMSHWIGQQWMTCRWMSDFGHLVYLPLAQKMPGEVTRD